MNEPLPNLGRRRFLQVSAGLVVGGGLLAACGSDEKKGESSTTSSAPSSSSTASTGGTAGPTEGLIGLTLNGLNDYTKGVTTGVYKALENTKYTLEVVQVNYDAAQELAAAEAFLAKGIVGLVIQPNTAESAGAAAEKAVEKGVPAGNCIWPGPSDADKYFVGVAEIDSVEGGRLIGEYLKANVTPGKVCVVQGVVGQGFSEKIDEGLDAALAGTDFEVVVREQAFFDRTQAVGVVEKAFQAHPDLGIVVAYSASMSNGISQWLKDQGKDKVIHVSSDADEEMITWMKTPYLSATRYYSSAQTGLIAANAVLASLRGETPQFRSVIEQVIATEDNIDAVVEANPYMFFEYKDKVQNI
ncbi:MAG TPA: sugar ABC transporter substrate-binding protein [Ilumatobacteraceae bacterium]|nr:sugar ABC transporter substrate-binding protein [Ilumatobacteraceae bacterium]